MAIATGGVVPEGADSVVPIEDVEEGDDAVTVPGAVAVGDNVRDLAAATCVRGDTVVVAGTRLGPPRGRARGGRWPRSAAIACRAWSSS